MKRWMNHLSFIICHLSVSVALVSCSMTKGIPDDDQLFTGLTKITFTDENTYDDSPYEGHLDTTKEEIEAALATEPNGSLFGSSYYTVPWSWHLWVYNKYASKNSGFAKWMTKSFGKPPVLMSQVNPALRAYSIEQAHGSTKLQDFVPSLEKKYAVVLGNEVKGVHQEVIDASDGCLEIPQFGTKHSMNVSVTAGIIIWHFAQTIINK